MSKFHTKPDVSETREAISRINDHLGRSVVIVHTWGNGEGISVELNDEDKKGSYVKEQRIELQWSQWHAIVACVKSLMKGVHE